MSLKNCAHLKLESNLYSQAIQTSEMVAVNYFLKKPMFYMIDFWLRTHLWNRWKKTISIAKHRLLKAVSESC